LDHGWQTHGVGKFHFQPILAPASFGMPESEAFWSLPQSNGWIGPYYGFQDVEFVIGESFSSVRGGHYAQWLRDNHPEAIDLYNPENALDGPPEDMDEVWQSAVPEKVHYNTWIADRAVNYIRNQSRKDPFFLYVSFPDPHHPFSPPAPYCNHFDLAKMPKPEIMPGELDNMPSYISNQQWLPGNRKTKMTYREFLKNHDVCIEQGTWQRTDSISDHSIRQVIAYTYAMVEMIDACVARVLETLEENGIMEKTLVVFTSDHGELLGDHSLLRKGPMAYRQLLNIPLLMSGPGLPEGARCDSLTSHLDIKSTILDYLGIEYGPGDGVPLMPLLRGDRKRIHEYLLAEYYPRTVLNQYNLSYITNDWRLTVYPLAEDKGWGELFDRKKDPNEHINLYHNKKYKLQLRTLREQMERIVQPAPDVNVRTLSCY
jgi:arylsulfatase A-like enzyme